MPGGRGKINEYNQQFTAEQRKANATRAAKAPRRKVKTIRELAQLINDAPCQKEARKSLEKLGLKDEDMTNAAMIAASVFRAAFEGDMRAVEKWERYIGQESEKENDDGKVEIVIDV